MLLYEITVLFVISLFTGVKCQYDDVRCKCVCPSISHSGDSSVAAKSPQIYIQTFHEPSHCKCEHIVEKSVLLADGHYCDRCNCQWQRRNTTTIKVVVLFIICVVFMLVFYMLFLLCLDPLMVYRQKAYTEHRSEELAMSEVQSGRVNMPADEGYEASQLSSPSLPSSSVVTRLKKQVDGRTERWKNTVSEQRRNIYDRHAMLN